MLILNAEEETVIRFIEELQRRQAPEPLGIPRNAASSPELSGAISAPNGLVRACVRACVTLPIYPLYVQQICQFSACTDGRKKLT